MPRSLAFLIALSLMMIFQVAHGQSSGWDFLDEFAESGLVFDLDNSDSDLIFDQGATGTVIRHKGGGHVSHEGVDLYADSINADLTRKLVFLEGNVRIYKGELAFKGNSATYNMENGKITAIDLRSGQDPVLFSTDVFRTQIDVEAKTADFLDLENATLTTHDSETPNYRIEASRIKVFPEPQNRVEMHDVKIFAGTRQIFWFPYLAKSIEEEIGWYFRPGFNSSWGAYLQSDYGFKWEDHTLVKYQLDFRSRRGLAGGVELKSQKFRDNENIGKMKFYYANDLKPSISRSSASAVRSMKIVTGSISSIGCMCQDRKRVLSMWTSM